MPRGNPVTLPRSQHPISRQNIDPDVLKVMYRLKKHGFLAYLVGGCVRDFLLGKAPKDFDVGTDARPNQVKKLFRNCYLVGRRFRLAHVRFAADKVVEVATFRRQPGAEEDAPGEGPKAARYRRENTFGTPEEDAWRRDFTINALFYDLATFAVIDYVGGLPDLEARVVRTIGDPDERFAEDPVRMLRALEFAARLDFTLAPEDREAIVRQAALISTASPARLREEILTLFRYGVSAPVLRDAFETGLFPRLLPDLEGGGPLWSLLAELDARTRRGVVPVEPFVLAALCLPELLSRLDLFGAAGANFQEVARLVDDVLTPLTGHYQIAARICQPVREALVLLCRIRRGRGKGAGRILQREAFPPALELFELWCRATGQGPEMAASWRQPLGEPTEKKRKKRGPRRRSGRGRPNFP